MVTAGNAPAASLLPGECGRRQGGSPPGEGEHFGVNSWRRVLVRLLPLVIRFVGYCSNPSGCLGCCTSLLYCCWRTRRGRRQQSCRLPPMWSGVRGPASVRAIDSIGL